MTPPSWAYPYATVWDDFDAADVVTMDGSLAGSGQTWVTPPNGTTIAYGITPYIIERATITSAWRGINQSAEHPSTMGWKEGVVSPPLGVGYNYYMDQHVLVPGATSDNFYVKSEFYTTSRLAGSLQVLDFGCSIAVADLYATDQWQRGYDVAISTNPYQVLLGFSGGPYPGEFPPGSGDSLRPMVLSNGDYSLYTSATQGHFVHEYYDTWHTWELRVLDGIATLYVDNVAIWRGPGQVPSFDSVYVSPAAGGDGVHSAYMDHFEAGPASVSPPVPILRAASGPTSLLFEPPRINV